ncbi:MAG TPA: hypothetical protein DCM86_18025 [Verrucomicrobiales bacterium]|nr:hypothetical protein [Verrucomicrobiales bacterium]
MTTEKPYRRWEPERATEASFLQEPPEELGRLKEQLLAVLLAEAPDAQVRTRYRWAAEEAAALAFSTPWPRLFFPTLLAEKTLEARTRATRQSALQARSGGRWTR